MELIGLCIGAGLAGFIDSIVGGGGLVQLPALMLFLPASATGSLASVFGTNKFSSIWGTATATAQYARRVTIPWDALAPTAGVALIFAWFGARAVSVIRPELLRPVVLVLLIVSAMITYARKDFGNIHAPRLKPRSQIICGVCAGAVIGFYDGFFGPGTGTFLIFTFISVFGFDFLTSSACAKVVNLATNIASVSYFASTGHILYRYAIPMAICNVVGAMLGARLAILKGNRFVRCFFLVIVAALIARLAYDLGTKP